MGKVKPRIIKNYEKLDDKLRKEIEAAFPNGIAQEIKTFDIGGGRFMNALSYENDDFCYLIKFPVTEDIDNDEPQDDLGEDDDMHLEGGEDVEEEEEDDEVEKKVDNLEDLEVADEGGADE